MPAIGTRGVFGLTAVFPLAVSVAALLIAEERIQLAPAKPQGEAERMQAGAWVVHRAPPVAAAAPPLMLINAQIARVRQTDPAAQDAVSRAWSRTAAQTSQIALSTP